MVQYPGLFQCPAGKEIRCIITVLEQLPVFILHHRGELLQIPYHQELHPAERPVRSVLRIRDRRYDALRLRATPSCIL